MHCIFCKSTEHNYRNCPSAFSTKKRTFKQNYTGETPNVFVGRHGYPKVNVGLLNTEEYDEHDNPLLWSRENYSIPKIVDLRSDLVNARKPLSVKATGFDDRFLGIAQEIGLAKKTVDVEIGLEKKPSTKTTFSKFAAPHGPAAGIKRARVSTNPKTNQKLEKAKEDTDWKATDAVSELYKKGVDEHALVKTFSVGNLGVKEQRKLVPTRWSITAVDDTISKNLIQEVKQNPEGDYQLFIGGHLGNYYAILFFDDSWQYELFEQQVIDGQATFIERDYESILGRKKYAEETAGGYYATRIAILEKLKQEKRQSAALVIRIITKEYTSPLGVWVVREAVRKALMNKPISFDERKSMIKYCKEYLQKTFNYNISPVLEESKLLENIMQQRRLSEF